MLCVMYTLVHVLSQDPKLAVQELTRCVKVHMSPALPYSSTYMYILSCGGCGLLSGAGSQWSADWLTH